MLKFKISLIAVLLFTYLTSFSQNFEGKWSGALKISGTELPIIFNITKKDTTYVTTMDSPAQNAFDLPTGKTIINNNEIEITAAGLGLSYKGVLQEDSIAGQFNQGGLSLPLTLSKNKSTQLTRPQEPVPPFPYAIEEIKFKNEKDKVELSGTLTIPDSQRPGATVVLVAGSGPHDRDETIFGHKPFWVIADFLSRNGIAVLRYDKRGVGQSIGQYILADTEAFARDAQAAVDYLRQRKETQHTPIGIIGHSEGGIIAGMLAATGSIDFAVMMAGMGIKGIDLVLDQNLHSLTAQNIEPENIEEIQTTNRTMFESLKNWEPTEENRTALRDQITVLWNKMPLLMRLKTNKDQFIRGNVNTLSTPWYRKFLFINPSTYLSQITVPVLALNGEKDTQVSASKNLSAIQDALEKADNPYFASISYPQLNHLFQESETGEVEEYIKIEQTIAPYVLKDITSWIQQQIIAHPGE